MSRLSPIIIFAYNRPDHLKKTINSLKKCFLSRESQLIIYIDDYQNINQKLNVDLVKKYCSTIKGFKKIKIIHRNKNFGLSKNITLGVNKEIKKYGSLIILEDDMICDRYFLKYMNFYLKRFEKNKNIVSIHGYNYPIKKNKNLDNFFFVKGADCWGWGTWKNKWKIYSNNSSGLLNKIKRKNLIKEFNFNNTYNYYRMLKDKINGKNDSWAINWYASAFLKNKLTLYPKYSLIQNIGIDGTGTHSKVSKQFHNRLRNKNIKFTKNLVFQENKFARRLFENYFISLNLNLKKFIVSKIKNAFKFKKNI